MNEHELEAGLRRIMKPDTDDTAARRVLTRLENLPPQKRAFAWWPSALMDWNFAPAWPRLAALAGAAVLGISIGLSSFGTRVAADLNLVRVAAVDDANVFDADSVTGLRP
jgi:anti-sigma factor RsiW